MVVCVGACAREICAFALRICDLSTSALASITFALPYINARELLPWERSRNHSVGTSGAGSIGQAGQGWQERR